MNEFLNRIVLDNSIGDYLTVSLIILGMYLLKKYFSRPIAAAIIYLLRKIGRRVDRQAFIKLILAPLEYFIIVLTAVIALSSLHFPEVLQYDFYKTNTKTIVDRIATALLIVSFFWLLLRMIDYLALVIAKNNAGGELQGEHQLIVFFKDFLKAIVSIAGILTVIKFAFRYQIMDLLTGLGIVGVALALSARESLENLIASFIIFFDKPFVVGDVLKVQQVTGTVERIGFRSTRLRTTEKTYVSVPNKQMVDSIVDNLSLRTQRRADLKLELDTATTAMQIQQLLDGMQEILQHPKIENRNIFLNDIVQQGYLVQTDYYTAPIPMDEFNAIKQEINLKMIRLMESLGIEMSKFPQQVKP
ncbi:mechanosensitive ion channel domain-containing protein [Agriterribacter sp.]|uniref:mechanosensitive ion channel family protein n=1 Tax=Agriterribacter sp. TaxID=2821509 RepID=UPI002CEBD753|nr:mechanosensitive ion channel domain-containing protein [Agriterribacter sp.]HRO44503.1 mechanosensitive ion channel [Agriterribacter sp.]HRQ16471.1 mechanosensitive ion channel [Agriterribacter sp.]